MKIFNAFFAVYRAILYFSVVVFLLITIGPMAVGIRPFVVQSASMEPLIETGSLAYIQMEDSKSPLADFFDYKEPEYGDVIAFKQGSGDSAITVVHRIYEVKDNGDFVMKGDNNSTTDIATVSRDSVVGQYKFTIPKLGYFVSKLTSKTGIIIAVILMAIAFVSSFISDGADEDIEEEKEKDETTNTQVIIIKQQKDEYEDISSGNPIADEEEQKEAPLPTEVSLNSEFDDIFAEISMPEASEVSVEDGPTTFEIILTEFEKMQPSRYFPTPGKK